MIYINGYADFFVLYIIIFWRYWNLIAQVCSLVVYKQIIFLKQYAFHIFNNCTALALLSTDKLSKLMLGKSPLLKRFIFFFYW